LAKGEKAMSNGSTIYYDDQTQTFQDAYGNQLSAADAANLVYGGGATVQDLTTGVTLSPSQLPIAPPPTVAPTPSVLVPPAPAPSAAPTPAPTAAPSPAIAQVIYYNPATGTYTDQNGQSYSAATVAQLQAAGIQVVNMQTGQKITLGPVSIGIAPTAAAAPAAAPGVMQQFSAWLAKGSNALYLFGGGAIGLLVLALAGGRKRR
jgi:hypothetical protein